MPELNVGSDEKTRIMDDHSQFLKFLLTFPNLTISITSFLIFSPRKKNSSLLRICRTHGTSSRCFKKLTTPNDGWLEIIVIKVQFVSSNQFFLLSTEWCCRVYQVNISSSTCDYFQVLESPNSYQFPNHV